MAALVKIILLCIGYFFSCAALFANISSTSVIALSYSNKYLSTIPMGVFIGCSFLVVFPAGALISKVGHRVVFILAVLLGLAGALLSILSVYLSSVVILSVATAPQGIAYGVSHYYRHMVANELTTEKTRSIGIGGVLSGGILAGLAGPGCTQLAFHFFPSMRVLPQAAFFFILVASFHVAHLLVLFVFAALGNERKTETVPLPSVQIQSEDLRLDDVGEAKDSTTSDELESPLLVKGPLETDPPTMRNTMKSRGTTAEEERVEERTRAGKVAVVEAVAVRRPFWHLLVSANFIIALASALFGHATMVTLMSATPLVMVTNGFSKTQAAIVVQLHVVGMYLPSLLVGYLCRNVGPIPLEVLGLLGSCIASASMPFLQEYWETYLPPLLLVGISWSFAYVSSTAHLAMSVQPHEKYKAQIIFDSIVFGSSTAINFALGPIIDYLYIADFVIAGLTFTTASAIILFMIIRLILLRGDIKKAFKV